MDSINYKKLYDLQDKVLDVVFTIEDAFYLTGGTALSRFSISEDVKLYSQKHSLRI